MSVDYACKFLAIINVIAIIFFGIILTPHIFSEIPQVNLDTAQKIFSIAGSLSLLVAIATYFYKKRQDKTLAAIEQVSFFRKEIISQWKVVDETIRTKDDTYWFCRIRIDVNTMEGLRLNKEITKNFNNQLSIFFDTSDSDPAKWTTNGKVMHEQANLLNMLEEFALKVQHFKTYNHPALNSLNGIFVELVEKNAVVLMFIRDITNGNHIYNSVYNNVLWLYSSWKDLSRKPNVLKNLQKHGFISRKQKEDIFNERKKRSENLNN